MSNVVVQALTVLLSLFGGIALIPGPDSRGNQRIEGPLGPIITYAGIVFFLGPWTVVPFLPQTRLFGWARILAAGMGTVLGVASICLYLLSLKTLLPAFRDRFSEFIPARLIVTGPYRYVRHPIYLSSLMIFSSQYLILGAVVSFLFLPFCCFLLRMVTLYEESRILLPKFSDAYLEYRERVKPAIFGLWGGLGAALLYAILAVAAFANAVGLCVFSIMD